MMNNFAVARNYMVDGQLKTSKVTDPSVLAAFGALAREGFLPEKERARAYLDHWVAMEEGRFMMEPVALARMIQALEPQFGERAMVIAAGTGYSAAILSLLGADVIAVESDSRLIDAGMKALAQAGIERVRYAKASLRQGDKTHAPYDMILIDGAVAKPPLEMFSLLAEGGRAIAIQIEEGVGRAYLWQKNSGHVSQFALFDAMAPYAPEFEPEQSFVF